MFQKGSKKDIRAWAFYDWANSVYSLVISTAIFPIYYESIASQAEAPKFDDTAIYSYSLSLSFLIVAILSPVLSGIADYTGNKKKFMKFFCYMGGLSVMALFFFDDVDRLFLGLGFSVLASVGFWGSLVFYNAYLPEVAFPEQQDKASANGFIYGYVGSLILLGFCLFMVMSPETFGMTDAALPSRISFVLVGLWWIGFAQVSFRRLPNNMHKRKPESDYLVKGWRELAKVWKEIKEQENLKKLLYSFFCYSIGVQTIILLATVFGSKELGMESSDLIITIMMVQLWGILGAFVFAKVSKRIGNIGALKITIGFWASACLLAFFLKADDPNLTLKFYGLGAMIGLCLGAIQTLSRSTYSKLIPQDSIDTATYFSFFDVTEKISIVLGTIIFGLVVALTGSMRLSILILGGFFVLGFIILGRIKRSKYVY